MRDGKCPKCNSTETYFRKMSALDAGECSVNLQAARGEIFSIETYICLNCRYIENHAAETSVHLLGKGKNLADMIRKSDQWKRV